MAAPSPRMVAWRPTAPRTLGTLSVVFGWIVGTFSAMQVISGGRIALDDDGLAPEAVEAFNAATHRASVAQSLILVAMSVALILIGSGMRSYQQWTTRAATRWSIGALFIVAAMAYVNGTLIGPEASALFSSTTNPDFAAMGPAMRWLGPLSALCYAPFPLVLLAQLRRPSFTAALDQPRRARR